MSQQHRPAPALRLLTARDGFVSMSALQGALDGLAWAPIQLATRVGARPISPRLPHALVLALALEAREAGQVDGGSKAGARLRGTLPDVIRLAAQVEATPPIVTD